MGELVFLTQVRRARSLIPEVGALLDEADTPTPDTFGWTPVASIGGTVTAWVHADYGASVQLTPGAPGWISVRYHETETHYEGLTLDEVVVGLEFGNLGPS